LIANTAHGIHSPYIYKLVIEVLRNTEKPEQLKDIEKLKKALIRNKETVQLNHLGAKSTYLSSTTTVSAISKISSSNSTKGSILFKLARFAQPNNIIELGTNLGLGTAYLAKGNLNSEVITIEGNEQLHSIAKKNLNHLGLHHVKSVHALFDDVFLDLLRNNKAVDMVFVDGNHTYEATLRYFKNSLPYMSEKGIIIFDDIYWSREMHRAWEEIKKNERVTATVDIYTMGIIFLSRDLSKQNFKIKTHQNICH
jgi:predicted O-methyltransferase YrrM